jgi:hypothetical protein
MVVPSMKCFFSKPPCERCGSSMDCAAAMAGEHYLNITTFAMGSAEGLVPMSYLG